MSQLTSDPAAAIAAARKVYEGEGLPFPPLRDGFAATLQQVAANAFATRELPGAIYNLPQFVDELKFGEVPNYTAFGFDGHGLISQAVHYYCVTNNAAVFLQFRWGTVFDEPEADRKRYAACMRIADQLLTHADEVAGQASFPKGQRIVAVYSSFTGSRWTWIPSAGVAEDQVAWRKSPGLALSEAYVALLNLSAS